LKSRGVAIGCGVWETAFVPKANLRPVPGSPPFQEFECSVCKARFSFKFELVDRETPGVLKTTIFKEWEAHLYDKHRLQWDAVQRKRAKLEAANRAKGFTK
jgi:hypothetical protein